MPRTSAAPLAVPDSPPANRQELQQFVERFFGISVPDRAPCPGHQSPLDYLAASFLDQEDLLVWACRGGGKTYLAAVATLLDAIFRAPADILVLGGSFDQSDRLAGYIRAFLERRPGLLDGRMTRQRVRLAGGSEIRMIAQSQQAVRGQHVQKIRCDEVDLFDPEIWRAVQFATQSRHHATGRVRGSIEVLSTLHRPAGLMQQLVRSARRKPGGVGYRLVQWCLWEVIERCHPLRDCQSCPLAADCVPAGADRGIAKSARGFYSVDDAIAVQARSSRAAWEAEMLCLGAQREHVVFREFNPARHIRELPYVPEFPLFRAIDFGYRSPLVCLWIQLTPGGHVHVIDEYVQATLPMPQQAKQIRQRDPRGARIEATYVDPAGRQREAGSGQSCIDYLAAEGIPTSCRASTICDGIELIRAALAPASGGAALFIHPRCERLIDAFQSYHYRDDGRDETPVKDGPDHCIDALRYFFVNRLRPRAGTRRGAY
jgi:hypothetical protein